MEKNFNKLPILDKNVIKDTDMEKNIINKLPILDKNDFRQWMLGMIVRELDVKFEDTPTLLKLEKCTEEIIRFAENHHLLVDKLS